MRAGTKSVLYDVAVGVLAGYYDGWHFDECGGEVLGVRGGKQVVTSNPYCGNISRCRQTSISRVTARQDG